MEENKELCEEQDVCPSCQYQIEKDEREFWFNMQCKVSDLKQWCIDKILDQQDDLSSEEDGNTDWTEVMNKAQSLYDFISTEIEG